MGRVADDGAGQVGICSASEAARRTGLASSGEQLLHRLPDMGIAPLEGDLVDVSAFSRVASEAAWPTVQVLRMV